MGSYKTVGSYKTKQQNIDIHVFLAPKDPPSLAKGGHNSHILFIPCYLFHLFLYSIEVNTEVNKEVNKEAEFTPNE